MNFAPIGRLFTHNIWWKLLSLALAVALWIAVIGEPVVVTVQTIPVLYTHLPPNLMLLTGAAEGVQVELRGPSRQLTHDRLAGVAVMIDLAGVKSPGDETFTVSRSEVQLPEGDDFLRAVPSQLHLRFDRGMTKDVPVEVQLSGSPPAGYKVTRAIATPALLRISGPEARVAALQSAQTDPVDVSRLTASTEVRINTFLADPRVDFQSPSVVTVQVSVEKQQ